MFKLLIADDEEMIRKGLESVDWKSIDVSVCGIAHDGKEALEIAEKKHPQIILSDIRMPQIDGLKLAYQLLSQDPNRMIIFLSGYSDFQYAHSALKMGAFDYLLKPTSPEEILTCVSRAAQQLRIAQARQATIAQMEHQLKQSHLGELGEYEPIPPARRESVPLYQSIGRILSYIEHHYMENITLASLSQEFHFNPIYINRILKRETGYTVMEIVATFRLDRAARLLRETKDPIAQVAQQVGIPDQRYFSQVFKKSYHCTPAQFRSLARVDLEQPVLQQLRRRFPASELPEEGEIQ